MKKKRTMMIGSDSLLPSRRLVRELRSHLARPSSDKPRTSPREAERDEERERKAHHGWRSARNRGARFFLFFFEKSEWKKNLSLSLFSFFSLKKTDEVKTRGRYSLPSAPTHSLLLQTEASPPFSETAYRERERDKARCRGEEDDDGDSSRRSSSSPQPPPPLPPPVPPRQHSSSTSCRCRHPCSSSISSIPAPP